MSSFRRYLYVVRVIFSETPIWLRVYAARGLETRSPIDDNRIEIISD